MADSQVTNVTISMDRNLKESAEKLFETLGMNMSTAFDVFVRQSLRLGKLPCENRDPFFSAHNQRELARRIADVKNGNHIATHDLIEDVDD